ncbi:MAG TPA: hypothetical protein VJQ43_06895 [Thermoplasmata archaeon]|nr:hypothetical protein [Thermoplasmata archaeon]
MSIAALLDMGLGIIDVLVPVGLLLAALVLVLRLAARGQLRRGIVYLVFLPERQRSLVRLFVLTVSFFLAEGIFSGLVLLQNLPETIGDLMAALTNIGAALGLFLLLTRGLAPHPLSTAERVQLDAQPVALAALSGGGRAGEFD